MRTIAKRVAAVEAVRAEFQPRRFAWGQADCTTLARALARALGAADFLADVAPYGGPRSARAALKRLGFPNLPALLDARLERIPHAFTVAGDIAAFESVHDAMPALALVRGDGLALLFAPDGRGLAEIPMRAALAAWRFP